VKSLIVKSPMNAEQGSSDGDVLIGQAVSTK
jgi:hypothetical protein